MGIQPVVARLGKPFWAVVRIEQDGIVRALAVADQFEHIAHMHDRARIVHGKTGTFAHRPLVPLHHLRHQLGHHHFPFLAHQLQHRGQGEAHAQAADHHTRFRRVLHFPQRQLGQRILRPMMGGGHQFARHAGHLDGIIIAALVEKQFAAVVGYGSPIQQLVDAHLHGCKVGKDPVGKADLVKKCRNTAITSKHGSAPLNCKYLRLHEHRTRAGW